AVETDLERAMRALATMQNELKGKGAAVERLKSAKVPSARTDAYFDLATFVEKVRELAARNEVDVHPEAVRFGFAAYANEGPDGERIEPVFQQRQVAQYILEALLESRPRALLAVKREPPVTKKEREDRMAAIRAAAEGGTPPEPAEPPELPEGPDFFAIDAQASARVPGYVDTLAYQVVFTGQTAALRNFVNRLAQFDLPVVVREVEVDTATTEETAVAAEEPAAAPAEPAADAPSVVLSIEPGATAAGRTENGNKASAAAPAPKKTATRTLNIAPIVARPWSKFTVTVEYIDLVSAAANSGEASAEPAPPGS
ncbi:MAG: Amuc_1100 family pilus-like protein, partial [Opitutaceae bacterium]|nr:Amuc_1100 family pilus-like protein [Opitutaceae bacterium]